MPPGVPPGGAICGSTRFESRASEEDDCTGDLLLGVLVMGLIHALTPVHVSGGGRGCDLSVGPLCCIGSSGGGRGCDLGVVGQLCRVGVSGCDCLEARGEGGRGAEK